jgi:hypothetical protein
MSALSKSPQRLGAAGHVPALRLQSFRLADQYRARFMLPLVESGSLDGRARTKEPPRHGGVYGPGSDLGRDTRPEAFMRSILLFAIGIPVPIILLLAFCTHHF